MLPAEDREILRDLDSEHQITSPTAHQMTSQDQDLGDDHEATVGITEFMHHYGEPSPMHARSNAVMRFAPDDFYVRHVLEGDSFDEDAAPSVQNADFGGRALFRVQVQSNNVSLSRLHQYFTQQLRLAKAEENERGGFSLFFPAYGPQMCGPWAGTIFVHGSNHHASMLRQMVGTGALLDGNVVCVVGVENVTRDDINATPSPATVSLGDDAHSTTVSQGDALVVEHDAPATQPPRCVAVEYTVLLRGIHTGSMQQLHQSMNQIGQKGFLNFSSIVRHGLHLERSAHCGRQILLNNFLPTVLHYAEGLAAQSQVLSDAVMRLRRELRQGERLGAAARRQQWQSAWRAASKDMRLHAELELEFLRECDRHGDISRSPISVLAEYVENAAEIIDPPRIAAELIPPQIMRDHFRSLADVHWNASASVRARRSRSGTIHVESGDLVCTSNGATVWDPFVTQEEFPPWDASFVTLDEEMVIAAGGSSCDMPLYPPLHQPAEVRTVLRDADTKDFNPCDIVLPRIGREIEAVHLPPASQRLIESLGLQKLHQNNFAPLATYRRLLCRPLRYSAAVFDDKMNAAFGDQIHRDEMGRAHCTQIPTVFDEEGIRRLAPFPSRNSSFTFRLRPLRRGIRNADVRKRFLSLAKPETGGFSGALRLLLPAGAALSSALREVFDVACVDASSILEMMKQKSEKEEHRARLQMKKDNALGRKIKRETLARLHRDS